MKTKILNIVMALLSVKRFQCMYTPVPAVTVADGPLRPTRFIDLFDYMDPTDSRKMRTDYANAKQRLIIFGKDDGLLKPLDKPNPEADQKKMTAALRHLAQDRKNEIWMVTDQDVQVFETAYGHIPNLNFAGRHGIQLSQRNTKSVELPNASLINDIENEAAKRIPYLPKTLMPTPFTKVEYSRQYFVPHGPGAEVGSSWTRADEMIQEMKQVIDKDPRFKDYEVKTTKNKDGFIVQLNHKYYNNKQMLVNALFSQQRKRKIDFALSIGRDPVDEWTHQATMSMMSRGNYALLVQRKDNESEFKMFKTFASHRLEDHAGLISFLENLASTTKLKLHLESLCIFFRNLKEKSRIVLLKLEPLLELLNRLVDDISKSQF